VVGYFTNWIADIPPYTLAVSLPYSIAFTLVAAEVAWLARRPGAVRRAILKSAATGTVMGAVALLVGCFYAVVLRFLWEQVAVIGWDAAARFWRDHALIGALATFVAWDFAGWVYHVIGHRTRIGWAAHQPHHSGTDFDSTLGLRQTWAPFHGLLVHPLLALFGFDLRVVVVCAAISNSWQVLEHTSVPVRFPRWFSAAVMTPATHRHHHGREGGSVNLGPLFTCWDRMAGTWVPAGVPPPVLYGPAEGAEGNPLRIEMKGWRDLLSGGGHPAEELEAAH
jgi:sterol desaturase/sphingolipid hydroxylase (fatty acid hydroxylase superfamily)